MGVMHKSEGDTYADFHRRKKVVGSVNEEAHCKISTLSVHR